jgi:hypothetical protein
MKEISLTQGKVVLVDDEDYEELNKYKWSAFRDSKGLGTYYAILHIWVNGVRTPVRMHRIIVGAKPSEQVDHRDGDGLNDQRNNLRTCTNSQNQHNRRLQKNNTTGFKGVYLHKPTKQWVSYIRLDGKLHYLGLYATPRDAAHAYDRAAKEMHGDFARDNHKLGTLK